MSYKSWQKKFLTKTDLEKWIGLRPKNLKKHGLRVDNKDIISIRGKKTHLQIDGNSCLLCKNYYNKLELRHCTFCPLRAYLGGRCDSGGDSPYQQFVNENNPEPMITALTAIREKLPKREKND